MPLRLQDITSAQNPRIKALRSLQDKSRERRERGLFVVEGRREILHCLEGGFEAEDAFLCPDILEGKEKDDLLSALEGSSAQSLCVGIVPSGLYAKIAVREGTEGIIAIFREKHRSLRDLDLPADALLMVLEGVEKPGNLGAVLRSADAAALDAVLLCDPLCDVHNPNLIRSSLGAVFTIPTVACSSAEAIGFLRDKGFAIYTAQLQDSLPYYDAPMTGPTAIVMGTESTGLSTQWREAATRHIRIPMMGKLDSLNVSVSAAVLLFEAVRQREERRH